MIHFGQEDNARRLERIIVRKRNVEKENATLIRRVFGPENGGRPRKEIISLGSGADSFQRIRCTRNVSEKGKNSKHNAHDTRAVEKWTKTSMSLAKRQCHLYL